STSRFVDEIHRYDGVLLEIGGDELFVLFGDEDPSKHVWKAAKAALAISGAATALKEELSSVSQPLSGTTTTRVRWGNCDGRIAVESSMLQMRTACRPLGLLTTSQTT